MERAIVKNRLAFAFLTNIPIVSGHTLVSPVRCVKKIDDLTSEEYQAIFDLVNKLKKVYEKLFGAEGFNCAWNEGEVAGQSVPHFHLHLLPRKKGDTGITEYDPRKFLYRPGSRKESTEEELKEIAQNVKNVLVQHTYE